MSEHVERFTGRVAKYARYRSRFPAAVMHVLQQRCGLWAGDLVADIGAGTGMLAEVLLEAGCRVLALEPNAEMRAACELLQGRWPELRVIAAAAEATGLKDQSLDLVTVGRAFHWFDQELALTEFKRILKPGGWLVLVTNRRDKDGSEQAREYERLLVEYGTDYAAVRGGYRSFGKLRPYGEGEHFALRIAGEELLTLEELIGQTQSLSVTPLPGAPGFGAMQAALQEFFARWSVDGVLRTENGCEIVGWQTPVAS